MEDSAEISPFPTAGVSVPPPPSVIVPPAYQAPLALRPLWIGFALAVLQAAFYFAARIKGIPLDSKAVPPPDLATLQLVYALLGIMAFVYYFMCIHRLIRILRTQQGWHSEFTPAGAVWRQLVPFYGLYVLYEWTGDVEQYTSWRLDQTSSIGIQAFLGLIVGFSINWLLRKQWIGHVLIFGALAILYGPVRRALVSTPPDDRAAPRYDGSLGLR